MWMLPLVVESWLEKLSENRLVSMLACQAERMTFLSHLKTGVFWDFMIFKNRWNKNFPEFLQLASQSFTSKEIRIWQYWNYWLGEPTPTYCGLTFPFVSLKSLILRRFYQSIALDLEGFLSFHKLRIFLQPSSLYLWGYPMEKQLKMCPPCFWKRVFYSVGSSISSRQRLATKRAEG